MIHAYYSNGKSLCGPTIFGSFLTLDPGWPIRTPSYVGTKVVPITQVYYRDLCRICTHQITLLCRDLVQQMRKDKK